MTHALPRKLVILLVAAASVASALPTAFGVDTDGIVTPEQLSDRYVPRLPGVQREMTFFYGPFTIPPGQDNNRVTLDIPVQGGFLVDVQANIYDVLTGTRPSNQMMHIHHAHWFRVSEDPNDEYYVSGDGLFGIAWVFGTGEERTKGDIDVRSAENGPNGPRYGVYIEPGQPQALIYMLHNKNAAAQNVYVALDVSFVYGSAAEIQDAPADCGPFPLDEGERCRAGEEFHHLHGTLWGNTWDVPRNFTAARLGVESIHVRSPTQSPNMMFIVSEDGTAIGTAGHLHPNGIDVIIANLGPAGSGCEADVDGDGYPGVTLAVSHKFPQVGDSVSSEEYQMGVTQDGWRAPVRAGDRIAQYGAYYDHVYASYEAMSYAGIYVDRLAPPAASPAECTSAPDAFFSASRAYLVEDGVVQPYSTLDNYRASVVATKMNDDWQGRVNHGHCGILVDDPLSERDDRLPCDDPSKPTPAVGSGRAVTEVHLADFVYVPGDQSVAGDLGRPARVTRGDTLRFVNEDVALGVRHSVSSCTFPCNGAYVANYPNPDGYFDSGKMGNLDYIDGGLAQTSGRHEVPIVGEEYDGPGLSDDAKPYWDLDTSELDPGMYSYYCRIHPWMRGWLEVAAP